MIILMISCQFKFSNNLVPAHVQVDVEDDINCKFVNTKFESTPESDRNDFKLEILFSCF